MIEYQDYIVNKDHIQCILSNWFKEKRINAGLSQTELANNLYVVTQTVANWENAKGFPDLSILESFCNAVGIDYFSVFEDKLEDLDLYDMGQSFCPLLMELIKELEIEEDEDSIMDLEEGTNVSLQIQKPLQHI